MDAKKIHFGGDFLGHEAGSEARSIEAPRHQSHADQVAAIVPPNGRRELMAPLPGNGRPRTVLLVQRNALHEVTGLGPQKRRAQPIARLARAAGHDGLVHEVVTEHGRALGATSGHGLPETGLRRPAVVFRKPIVPGGHVPFSVAAQARNIQVEMDLLGQFDQPAQPREACFARRFRRVEEPADLEVDADDICPQPFHRTEISLDLGPLRLPVVFQQSALGIVIVVQSPRHERPPRGLVDEARPIFRDADRFHLGGRGDTTEDEKNQGKKMERFGEHGKRTKEIPNPKLKSQISNPKSQINTKLE